MGVARAVWDKLKDAVDLAVFLRDFSGFIEDEIVVQIAGNPRATKADVFKMAAALAFGTVKRLTPFGGLVGNPPGAIAVEYDAAANEIVFILKFHRSLAMAITNPLGVKVGDQPVFSGPREDYVGGEADFEVGAGLGLIRVNVIDLANFKGKTILTTNRTVSDPDPTVPAAVGPLGNIATPNPRPSGDARSRGSLVALVTQTLATPSETGPTTFPAAPDFPSRFSGS
jgi:hypothetical protein